MKLITAKVGAALLLGIVANLAIAQENSRQRQPVLQESVIRKATVQDINYKDRTVTLKGERGNIVTIKVGDEVRNFDQIKKGDQVTAQYTESLALGIRKSNEPPSASQQESLTRAQPGEKPGGKQVLTTEISATVEEIDRDKREVTLRGQEGNRRKLKVGKNVEGFDNLKPGDQVVATYTEEYTIAVRSPQE